MNRSTYGAIAGLAGSLAMIAIPPEIVQEIWGLFTDKPISVRLAMFLAAVWTSGLSYIAAHKAPDRPTP